MEFYRVSPILIVILTLTPNQNFHAGLLYEFLLFSISNAMELYCHISVCDLVFSQATASSITTKINVSEISEHAWPNKIQE